MAVASSQAWHVLPISKREDGYFLSIRRETNKQKNPCAQQITNSTGFALGHHQGLLIIANSLLPQKGYGQEISQWHRMTEGNFLGAEGAVWDRVQSSPAGSGWVARRPVTSSTSTVANWPLSQRYIIQQLHRGGLS